MDEIMGLAPWYTDNIGGSPRYPLGVIGSDEESIFMEDKGIEEENKGLRTDCYFYCKIGPRFQLNLLST